MRSDERTQLVKDKYSQILRIASDTDVINLDKVMRAQAPYIMTYKSGGARRI